MIDRKEVSFVEMLPAYPKVRRTHYLARLGGWPVALWGEVAV